MNKNRKNFLFGILLVKVILGSPAGTFYYRVYGFEVTRVRHQFNFNLFPVFGFVLPFGAQVVFNVPGALNAVGIQISFKVGEYFLIGLVHDIHEDIQPSPVSHAHKYFLNLSFSNLLQHGMNHGNHGIRTFKREALMADILLVQKLFEGHRLVKLVQNSNLILLVKFRRVGRRLHSLTQPFSLVKIKQVHEFGTYLAAVGIPEQLDDFTQRGGFIASESAAVKLTVQIPEGKPVVFKIKFGTVARFVAQRVEVGKYVPAGAVHVDKPHNGNGTLVLLQASSLSVKLSYIFIFAVGDGFIWDLQIFENLVIKIFFPVKQAMNIF